MVFIQATVGNEILSLKDDHPMTIMFKRVQNSKTANLFSGQKGLYDEIKWSLLQSVHNDTIAIRKDKITQMSYGEERVEVNLEFIIGNDTVPLTDENEEDFAKIISRIPAPKKILVDKFFGDSILVDDKYNYDPLRLYVFETTTLGYINCDIFIEDELLDFTVKLENNESDVFIVMDSLKSVLYPDSIKRNTNEYLFKIPKSKPISVVAYRKENDNHFLGLEKLASNSGNLTIKQIKLPLEDIIRSVKKLE